MVRNRNSFFQEAQFSQQSYMPGINYNMPINASSSSYYSGPVPNNNFDDYESRLSKIERQINRLDARISKLENKSLESIDINSNMYML